MRWTLGPDAALDKCERSTMAASAKVAHGRSAQPASAAGLVFRAVFVAGLAANLVVDRLRVGGLAGASAAPPSDASEADVVVVGLVVRVRVVRAFGFSASPADSSEAVSATDDAVVADGVAADLGVRVRRTGLADATGSGSWVDGGDAGCAPAARVSGDLRASSALSSSSSSGGTSDHGSDERCSDVPDIWRSSGRGRRSIIGRPPCCGRPPRPRSRPRSGPRSGRAGPRSRSGRAPLPPVFVPKLGCGPLLP